MPRCCRDACADALDDDDDEWMVQLYVRCEMVQTAAHSEVGLAQIAQRMIQLKPACQNTRTYLEQDSTIWKSAAIGANCHAAFAAKSPNALPMSRSPAAPLSHIGFACWFEKQLHYPCVSLQRSGPLCCAQHLPLSSRCPAAHGSLSYCHLHACYLLQRDCLHAAADQLVSTKRNPSRGRARTKLHAVNTHARLCPHPVKPVVRPTEHVTSKSDRSCCRACDRVSNAVC